MKQIKKILGILLVVVGVISMALGILMLGVNAAQWETWGFHVSDFKRWIIALTVFVGLGGLLVLLGVKLLRRRVQEIRAAYPKEEEGAVVHSYRSAPFLMLGEFFKKFLVILLLWGVTVWLGSKALQLPVSPVGENPWIFWALALVPAAVLAAFWAFHRYRIRIEVGVTGAHFYRGKKQYAFYPPETELNPRVTKKKWGGLSVGTKREFFIPVRGHRIKWVRCWCLGNADFSRLVEDLKMLKQYGSFEKPEEDSLETLPGSAAAPGRAELSGETGKPGKPAVPDESAAPVKPVMSGEAVTPGESAAPVKPVMSGEAVTSGEAKACVKTEVSGEAAKSVKAAAPGGSEVPDEAAEPDKAAKEEPVSGNHC